MIDEMAMDEDPPAGGNGGGGQQNVQNQALLAQVHALRRELAELRTNIENNNGENCTYLGQNFGTLNHNVRRMAAAPARVIHRSGNNNNNNGNGNNNDDNADDDNNNQGGAGAGNIPFNVTLSRLPRSLFDLWAEYDVGIGGRKAAKDFTAAERGRVKYNYHQRKVVWNVIAAKSLSR